MQAKRAGQDLGHTFLLGSMGRKLWGSQAEARLVNSNPTRVSSMGVLSKEHI